MRITWDEIFNWHDTPWGVVFTIKDYRKYKLVKDAGGFELDAVWR